MILEEKRTDHISAKIFFESLIIVYCGNQLKYGKLTKTESHSEDQEVQIFIE